MSNEKVVEEVSGGHRLYPPVDTPIEIVRLMKKCWQADPQDRPTMSDVTKELNKLRDKTEFNLTRARNFDEFSQFQRTVVDIDNNDNGPNAYNSESTKDQTNSGSKEDPPYTLPPKDINVTQHTSATRREAQRELHHQEDVYSFTPSINESQDENRLSANALPHLGANSPSLEDVRRDNYRLKKENAKLKKKLEKMKEQN